MTMQTTSLPFQITGANALSGANAAGTRSSSSQDKLSANVNGGFGATLSRELAQRQQTPQTTIQAPSTQQSQQTQQAKPSQQQQSKPNAADKPASREPVHQAAAKPASESKTETKSAEASDTAEEASATEAAAAGAPAADMLAFMASLIQPAAGTAGGDAAEAGLAGGGQQLTALENALQNLKGAATGADASGTGPDLAAGVQLPAVDAGAVRQDAAALLQERGQQDAAGFQAHLRDAQQAVPAAAEEAAPPLAQLQAQAAKLAEVQNPAATGADRIPARVGTQAWDNQVSQRIVYMVGKEQAATLTLNPPDLGPVQVVLNVSNDQASVAFSSQQLEVRQALENALPRLREMMSESGIALGNATVDAGTANQQGSQDNERRANGNGGNGGENGLAGAGNEPALNEVAPRATRSVAIGDRGMVDLFA